MILRQSNFLGQQRIDAPHLRAMESSVAADFDVLAGRMLAGTDGLVIKGFNVLMTGAVGAPATSLLVRVADALVMHFGASEAGTVFWVASDQADEQLSSTNTKVTGSFSASQTNYIGIDLRRQSDDTTADNVQFLDADTLDETSKTVPLARTLEYRFVVGTSDFSSQATVLPIAKVVTDASNNVVSVQDARNLMFRLGSGGDFPSAASSFAWPGTRYENTSGDVFTGGDKVISSQKQWMDALMSRLWELGGGEYWYSATADRNVNMIWTGTTFTNGENFEWSGTHLHWKGLRFLVDNSSGYVNDLNDQTGDSSGLTNLAPGECLYVDLDRSKTLTASWAITTAYVVGDLVVNGGNAYECITAGTSAGSGGPTGTTLDITDGTVHWKYIGLGGAKLTAVKGVLMTLGGSTTPGARQILAWRIGSKIYTRGWRYAVGTTFTPATTTSLGVVKLHATPTNAAQPMVATVNETDFSLTIAAIANDSFAVSGRGHGTGPGLIGRSAGGQGGYFIAGAAPGVALAVRGGSNWDGSPIIADINVAPGVPGDMSGQSLYVEGTQWIKGKLEIFAYVGAGTNATALNIEGSHGVDGGEEFGGDGAFVLAGNSPLQTVGGYARQGGAGFRGFGGDGGTGGIGVYGEGGEANLPDDGFTPPTGGIGGMFIGGDGSGGDRNGGAGAVLVGGAASGSGLAGAAVEFNGGNAVFTVAGQIKGMSDPTDIQDAATKAYTDLVITGRGGRLSLTTNVPVTTADVTGAATVYYTPYMHNIITVYDGTNWVAKQFNQMSQTTADATKSPAAVANNSNYDIFVWDDAGTLRATRGPAWSSGTTRGTGAGTTELEQFQGRWVNKIAITNGPAARLGLYVGSIRSDGSAQINDSATLRCVWNMYNRVIRKLLVNDNGSWSYSTNTIRQANGSAANQLAILRGLDEDAVEAVAMVAARNSTTTARAVQIGIGLDSTVTFAADCLGGQIPVDQTVIYQSFQAQYRGLPGLGSHLLTWLENGAGTDTQSWTGGGVGAGIMGTMPA